MQLILSAIEMFVNISNTDNRNFFCLGVLFKNNLLKQGGKKGARRGKKAAGGGNQC